jgi:hypothetical protein
MKNANPLAVYIRYFQCSISTRLMGDAGAQVTTYAK